jgi:hypothetical protein
MPLSSALTMAIRNYGTTEQPVYLATTKAERDKLIREGAIVYSQAEFDVAQQYAELVEPLAPIINRLKEICPTLQIAGVRRVRRK